MILKAMGIDPGGTTGYVIASVSVEMTQFILTRIWLDSTPDPSVVSFAIKDSRPRIVYLERRATNPTSKAGLDAYETITRDLQGMEYTFGVLDFMSATRGVKLISPGLWKPFMLARSIDLPESWMPDNQHEADALGILHYGLQTNSPKKRVCYA